MFPAAKNNDPRRARLVQASTWLLCLWTAMGLRIAAQDNPALAFSRIGLEQGLPAPVITALAEDSTGMVWIGTRGGLARYDGSELEVFRASLQDPCAIAGDNILRCFVSRKNRVYTTGLTGWSRFDAGRHCFANRLVPDSIIEEGRKDVLCLWTDNDTLVWLGTYAGLLKFSEADGTWTKLSLPTPGQDHENRPVSVHDIQSDPEDPGSLLLATSRGIVRFDRNSNRFSFSVPPPRGPWPDISPTSLYAPDGGPTWLGLWGNGLGEFRPQAGSWKFYHTPAGRKHIDPERGNVPWDVVRAICGLGDTLLLGYHRGLGLLDTRTGTLTLISHQPADPASLSDNTVLSILRHSSGRIYVGTMNGLNVSWAPGQLFTRMDPLADDGTHGAAPHTGYAAGLTLGKNIVLDEQEAIYVDQTAGGLHRINRTTGASGFIPLPGLDPFPISDVISRGPDHLVIAGRDALYDLDLYTRRLMDYPGPAGQRVKDLRCHFPQLAAPAKDKLIVWDRRHLIVEERNEIRSAISFPYENIPYVSALVSLGDTALMIWADRDPWLFRLADNQFVRLKPAVRMEFEARYGLFIHGDLWIDSWGGLYRYRMKGDSLLLLRRFTTADGLPSNILHALALDPLGRIWGGTDTGLFRVDTASGFIRAYNALDGILYPLIDQEVAFFSDGTILVNDHRYAYFMSPDAGPASHAQAYIRRIDVGDTSVFDLARPIRLSKAQRSFSAHFGVIDHVYGNRNTLYYKLDGFDAAWQRAGRERSTRYTNLRPGRYVLSVRASNPDGEFTPATSVTLLIPPKVHEQKWFYPTLAALVLAAALLFLRLRLDALRKKERDQAAINRQLADLELQALRSQMNPHFMFNSLNSIKNYILQAEPKKAADYLSRFGQLIRLILQRSGDPTITVQEELEMILLYIELEQLRFRESFTFTCHVGEGIDLEAVRIPPMLLQPYVENAIWHGLQHKDGERQLSLSFTRSDLFMHCRIEDNGVGRAAARSIQSKSATRHKPMGMQIARDRIALLNETRNARIRIDIHDLQGPGEVAAGTRVDIFIPYESHPD